MTPERYEQVRELFLAVRAKSLAERVEFLTQACGGDYALRAEVESLLESNADADSFLQEPILGNGFGALSPESLIANEDGGRMPAPPGGSGRVRSPYLPHAIGQYEIFDVLGEGGMGIVYRARQENPRRTVALKVIKPGGDSRHMRKRFEYEGQVLGWLQHPGIAQIFEAGTAETIGGPRPFFAMELIQGRPLTEYVRSLRLGVRLRLELMVKVCDAVHHAHQKGVIHRDLKPGNILVDENGQPKVLDFGVARATDADIRTATLQTDVGQLVGTLAYMSPEQMGADSGRLDTRSDVYSLGVICYELLTGRVPHDISRKTIPQAARLIGEEDPPSLGALDRSLRGDVDTIVTKALEKDKDRRYQSASDLAEDIRRHLADQPIAARAATTVYQLRKFARRNKALVAGLGIAFAALSGGLVQVTLERNRAVAAERLAEQRRGEAETQRVAAEQQAAIARAINEFLNDDLLAAAGPLRTPDRQITVREVLDAASKNIAGKFTDQPETEASIRNTLGRTYEHLGEYDAAKVHLTEALRLYRESRGDQDLNTFNAMEELALVFRRQAAYEEAEELFRESLEGKRELLGDAHLETAIAMNDLATLYHTQGRHAEAERLYLESLSVRRQLFGENHPETAACVCNLANLYQVLGRYDEAERLHVGAWATRKQALGEEHVDTLMSMNSLAKVYNSKDEPDRAERLWRGVLEVRRRTLGEGHPDTLKTMNNLAVLYLKVGRYEEAERMSSAVLDAQRAVLGEQHPHVLVSIYNLADVYLQMGRLEQAAAMFEEAIVGSRSSLPDGHWYTGVFLSKFGDCLNRLGRFAESETALIAAHQNLSASLGVDHDRTRSAAAAIADLYDAWGKADRAAEWRETLSAAKATEAAAPGS